MTALWAPQRFVPRNRRRITNYDRDLITGELAREFDRYHTMSKASQRRFILEVGAGAFTAPTSGGGGGGGTAPPDVLPYQYTFDRADRDPWPLLGIPVYDAVQVVDYDLGDDGDDGLATSSPVQSIYQAITNLDDAGTLANACVWVRGAGRVQYEYFSRRNKGFDQVAGGPVPGTITNLSNFMDGKGGANGAPLVIRTWWEDVIAGQLAILDGSGIPLGSWQDAFGDPNLLSWDGAHDVEICDIEMRSCPAKPTRFDFATRVVWRNHHAHHCNGDGGGGRDADHSGFTHFLTHHHWDDINGGNSSERFQTAVRQRELLPRRHREQVLG